MTDLHVQRILAHCIRYKGQDYHNHVVELDRESGRVTIVPFTQEIHSTVFRNGWVEVSTEYEAETCLYRLTERVIEPSI